MDEEVSEVSARVRAEGGETFEEFMESLVAPETG